jgi:hypothetical protein
VAQTCSGWGLDMSIFCLLEPSQETRYVRFFGKLVWKVFSTICTSPTHTMDPLDSTWLLEHIKLKLPSPQRSP